MYSAQHSAQRPSCVQLQVHTDSQRASTHNRLHARNLHELHKNRPPTQEREPVTAHTVVGHLDTGDTRACHGHTPLPTQNQSALDTLPYAQVVCALQPEKVTALSAWLTGTSDREPLISASAPRPVASKLSADEPCWLVEHWIGHGLVSQSASGPEWPRSHLPSTRLAWPPCFSPLLWPFQPPPPP